MARLLRHRLALDDELVVEALVVLIGDWSMADDECRLRVALFLNRHCADVAERAYAERALRLRMAWTTQERARA